MKNWWLEKQFHNMVENQGTPFGTQETLTEAKSYIEFLESKEDRLTKLEGVLNSIEDSKQPGYEAFLSKFKELKTS